jgi:very-short-patch-repair endonuclease
MMRKITTIKCKLCGKEVSGNFKQDQVFCSRQCAAKGKFKPKTNEKKKNGQFNECQNCQKIFYVPKSAVNKKFCSMTCRRLFDVSKKEMNVRYCLLCKKSIFGSKLARYCSRKCASSCEKSIKLDTQCAFCGSPMRITVSRYHKSKFHFCCVDHVNEWQRKSKVSIVCKVCNVSFLVSPSAKDRNRKYCSLQCRDNDPDVLKNLIQLNIKQQKLSPNNLEILGYSILDSLKVVYEKQFVIGEKFCVDAFVPSANLIIQFDGDYWHGNTDKFPNLTERQMKRIRLDKSQDSYMNKCGYRVLRLWASDMLKDKNAIANKISDLII